MSARPSVSLVSPHQGAALLSAFSSGNIEALKWLGVVAMVIEHVSTVLLRHDGGWPFQIGRVAFPLFGLAFALAVSERPSLRSYRAAFRLLPFALVAQVGSFFARDSSTLNVLFLFVAAAAWIAAGDESPRERVVVRVLALGVAFFSEFWWPGLAFIVGMVWALRAGGARAGVVVAWCGLLVCALLDHTPMAFFFVVVAVGVCVLDVRVRRVPWVFACIYAMQFPLFLLVRWLHG